MSPGAREIVASLTLSDPADANCTSTVTSGCAPAWALDGDTLNEPIETSALAVAVKTMAPAITATSAVTAFLMGASAERQVLRRCRAS